MGILPSRLFELTKQLSGIMQDLEASGITIEIGDDFARYRALRSQQKDRGAIYPMFDVASSYIDRGNGFWICGFNPNGELIHTQAVRLLDLTGTTLATHLHDHRHKYITPDTTPDPDQTFYSGPEALRIITGKVCYQGDFWLRARGLGGPRSQGATALLSRVLLEVMVGAWTPSFVFAFVPKQLGAKGAHLRYGYNHCEPGRWLGPDMQVTEEDYLIWMGANDMANLVGREPLNLQRPAGVSAVRTNGGTDVSGVLDARAII
ncbi:hypothetical protein [uncultured Roseobacter sp.]|uniref:hypothetical protein n=1 Tax=uncultured Roseobacter sp. TaxID=114847 RepID=UPI00262B37E8|nr:hypothetical protein [uncultured Roseobacter sp.]